MLEDLLCELERVLLHLRAFEESFPDMPAFHKEHLLIAAHYLMLAKLHLHQLPIQNRQDT